MGYKKIKEWINEAVTKDGYVINELHEPTMIEIFDAVSEDIAVPEKIEILGASRTYKIIFFDRSPLKITLGNKEILDMQNILYSNGVRVPENFANIERANSGYFWKVDKWVEGECLRESVRNQQVLQKIAPKYWFKKGELLGEISNYSYCGWPITMCDILWSNFAINYEKDEVWLIDCKKLRHYTFPEKWVFEFIIFNQYHLTEQLEAFTEGYLSTIKLKKGRIEHRDPIIKHAKMFSERLYEKLAELNRV